MRELLPIGVFFIPFVTAICMPMIGHARRAWCGPIAMAAVFVSSLLAIANFVAVLDQGTTRYAFGGWSISTGLPVPPLGIEWVNDPLASVMLVTVSSLATLCLLYGRDEVPRSSGAPSLGKREVLYHTLVLVLIAGLIGIVLAGDIFNVFVFLEVVALSAYALVGVSGGRALVAAFRYLILGTLGSSFYLLGVVFLYAATGTLNMADLSQQLTERPDLISSKAIIGGVTFLLIGLGIKMALFPLHGWLPAAYARSPNAVTPLLAGLMTKVALYAWVRILLWVLGAATEPGYNYLMDSFSALGAVAAVAGALLALVQQNLKRMFAYGGVSHVGLIAIGIGQGTQTGFAGSMFYMLNDAFMQAGAFFIAGAAISQYQASEVKDLTHLRQSKWMIGTLIVLAMAMIGVPPTGGFFGKWQIILSSLETGNYFAVASIVIATVLTMAYFQRLFVGIFREQSTSLSDSPIQERVSLRVSLFVTSIVIVGLGLFADPIIQFFRVTAAPAGL